MVKTLAIHLNDSDFDELKAIKDEFGYTWEEFILEAADALENQSSN